MRRKDFIQVEAFVTKEEGSEIIAFDYALVRAETKDEAYINRELGDAMDRKYKGVEGYQRAGNNLVIDLQELRDNAGTSLFMNDVKEPKN